MSDKSLAPSSAGSLASSSLARADGHISHLTRLIASSANADTTLLTIGYTASLLASLLGALERARIQAVARGLASKAAAASSQVPAEALAAAAGAVAGASGSRLVRGQAGARAVAALIGEHRMFVRLWGLPKLWVSASRVLRQPPSDGPTLVIAGAQLAAGAAFQFLENSAFLASKGVIAMEPRVMGLRFKWSARLWCTFVMLEFARLLRGRAVAQQARARGEVDEKSRDEHRKAEAKWWRDLYVNAAWAPVTVHYSLMQSPLPDELVTFLSLTAGWMGLKQAWIATA